MWGQEAAWLTREHIGRVGGEWRGSERVDGWRKQTGTVRANGVAQAQLQGFKIDCADLGGKTEDETAATCTPCAGPAMRAGCRREGPTLVLALTSARAAISRFTTSVWPCWDAMLRGLWPVCGRSAAGGKWVAQSGLSQKQNGSTQP